MDFITNILTDAHRQGSQVTQRQQLPQRPPFHQHGYRPDGPHSAPCGLGIPHSHAHTHNHQRCQAPLSQPRDPNTGIARVNGELTQVRDRSPGQGHAEHCGHGCFCSHDFYPTHNRDYGYCAVQPRHPQSAQCSHYPHRIDQYSHHPSHHHPHQEFHIHADTQAHRDSTQTRNISRYLPQPARLVIDSHRAADIHFHSNDPAAFDHHMAMVRQYGLECGLCDQYALATTGRIEQASSFMDVGLDDPFCWICGLKHPVIEEGVRQAKKGKIVRWADFDEMTRPVEEVGDDEDEEGVEYEIMTAQVRSLEEARERGRRTEAEARRDTEARGGMAATMQQLRHDKRALDKHKVNFFEEDVIPGEDENPEAARARIVQTELKKALGGDSNGGADQQGPGIVTHVERGEAGASDAGIGPPHTTQTAQVLSTTTEQPTERPVPGALQIVGPAANSAADNAKSEAGGDTGSGSWGGFATQPKKGGRPRGAGRQGLQENR